MFRILAIAASLLGATAAVHADVYRWVDGNGTVQYSDRWVPGSVLVKTDKNRDSGTPPVPADAGAERADALVAEQQNRRLVEQDVAQAKAEQCKRATELYDKAVQSRRIYREGPNGAREYMNDADADAYRMRMLNARKEACGA